jgi:tryptophanase
MSRPTRTIIEPFKIKMVEPLQLHERETRERVIQEAGYNLFQVPSEFVTFDFLTDSGTTAMSTNQWSAMMRADESYAGSSSFFRFREVVQSLTGYQHVIPTHQGRASERLLFGQIIRPGHVVPSNNHFDTTRANIEHCGGKTVDLVIAEGLDPASDHPFKGNIDVARLERFCEENRGSIPAGMATLTNNSGGGQPVSLENLRAVSAIYRKHGIPFILDACRYAENCWFIHAREPGQSSRTPREIAQEVFSLADGMLMSGKKDALVNMGGFIALKAGSWIDDLRSSLIMTEGFPTYGGLAARDLEAMGVGLEEALDPEYLRYRVATTQYMAKGLEKLGIPVVRPTGGHAVFIDARRFLPHIAPEHFPGQSLAIEIYLNDGVRTVEVGSASLGKRDPEGRFVPAAMDLVRLAFPRRCYTQSHFDYVLEGMESVVARKEALRGMRILHEPPVLRQFTARFAPLSS